MKILYIDCRYGISGDMFVSALFDLGVDFFKLKNIFEQSNIKVEIEFNQEKRSNIIGKKLNISWQNNQPLRNIKEIFQIIDKINLSEKVIKKSKSAFKRLAEVEALTHGVNLEDVHFHEIGAIDTLWDIIATFWGIETLNIKKVESSPIPWFNGEIDIYHGKIPLPSPATTLLLKNKPIFSTQYNYELVTPTGALILDQLVNEFKEGPDGILLDIGIGYGQKKQQFFNGLRLFLMEKEDYCDGLEKDEIYILESNIDHLTGEELGFIFDYMLKKGALDIIYIPGIMKKNRPGGVLQILCKPSDLNNIAREFFKSTLTLGIRIYKTTRLKLKREIKKMLYKDKEVRLKRFYFDNEEYEKIEFESIKEIGNIENLTPIQVRFKKSQSDRRKK